MPWSTSGRRARLPKDWPKRVALVKARAHGRCQAETHVAECNGIGTDCDHVKQGDDHSLANLQWLSRPCHKAKTRAEASTALKAMHAKGKHPVETHPGMSNRT